jgi:RimJ/RimL family protein N-acetyltransferase
MARDLSEPVPTLPPPHAVVLRTATAADLPVLASTMEPFRRDIWNFELGGPLRSLFQERLAAGDHCLIAESGGEFVYMAWTRFDSASEGRAGIVAPLRAGESYGYGVFTVPAFRGRGVATAAAAERFRHLRNRGVRRFYGWVSRQNSAMLAVEARLEYRAVARVRRIYWRLGRRVSLLNHVVYRPDPLAEWCSPARLSFDGGLSIFRRGTVVWRGRS